MKKYLLLAAATAFAASQSTTAQSIKLLDEIQVSRLSNDGKTVVSTDADGNMTINNVTTDETLYFSSNDGKYRYAVGFGNIFDDNGNMVGNIDDNTPAILSNGVWTPLPLNEEDRTSGKLNSADGITPDGRRICGGVARSSFGLDADDVMMAPVIWERNDNGTYDTYTVLPYPTLDFTKRVAQYVTARSISADGKTVIGQIVDYSGAYPLPIVYREDNSGNWTYQIVGANLVYNPEALWPTWIEKEPQEPDATEFMTTEKAAEYEEAYTFFREQQELYWEGKIDEYPVEPNVNDYLSDTEGYEAAMAQYEKDRQAYIDNNNLFIEAFNNPDNVYFRSFNFNSVFISSDGRYMTAMYAEDSEDPDNNPEMPAQDFRVVRFDLSKDGTPMETCSAKDGLPTYVMNDGTVMYATPVESEVRESYVWPMGTTSATSLYDYLLGKDADAAKLVKDNLTYNSIKYSKLGTQQKGPQVIATGTAMATGDGDTFVGWLANGYFKAGNWEYKSYVLDTKNVTGICMADATEADITNISVTNANGMFLYSGNDSISARNAMANGVNIVTMTMSNGKTKAMKIIKK